MTTSPAQGEHAQTEALRPKFGDLLRNTMASESNPRRDAYFIREVHRSGGGVNPGRWFEMTDGKGETWLSNPQNMVPAAPAQPAAPQGVAYAELADVDALAQEIRRVDGSHNLGAGAVAGPDMVMQVGTQGFDLASTSAHFTAADMYAASAQAFREGQTAAPTPAAQADSVLEDADRWRMAVLVGKEVMLHPEKRTHANAVKAYMDAVHSGLDLTGAVDAARKQGGKHDNH